MNKDFTYPIRDSSLRTVSDLVFGFGSIARSWNVRDLLAYTPDGGQSNFDAIYEAYTPQEQREYYDLKVTFDFGTADEAQLGQMPIRTGMVVSIPFDQLERPQIFAETGNQIIDTSSFASFLSDDLVALFANPAYRQKHSGAKNKYIGKASHIFPNLSVWIWSRSLNTAIRGSKLQYDDQLVNVTPFVRNLNVSKQEQGGSFSFTLPPLLCTFLEGRWQIVDGSVYIDDRNYAHNASLHEGVTAEGDLKRASFYFDRILQENDLVFIRFETLESEEDRPRFERQQFIDKKQLPGQNYDMIGLLDQPAISGSYGSADVGISIPGRDLMKLLIEDGVYFYPLEHTGNSIFANLTDRERLLRYDGQIRNRFQYSYKSLSTAIRFIINALSSVDICSNTLFKAYDDRRSRHYTLTNTTESLARPVNSNLSKEIEEQIETARTVDNLTASSTAAVYQELFQFVQHLENESAFTLTNFIPTGWEATIYEGEALGPNQWPSRFYDTLFRSDRIQTNVFGTLRIVDNTSGAPLTFTNVANSNAGAALILTRDSIISSQRQSDYKPEIIEDEVRGIWQIVKLIIDPSVDSRRIVDGSIGNEHGSLINAIKKVCQEPFVEFMGDTYGDQYYFTVRKYPYDKEGIYGLLYGRMTTDTNESRAPMVIDLEGIRSDSLTYGGPAYSWYILRPKASFPGGAEMALIYLKAVYLREYADVFGSKPYDIPSNYIPFYPTRDAQFKSNVGYMIRQGIRDLKYLIESNAYMPFVRSGTITIDGDRRIKKGTLVRLPETNEIYYVSGVSANWNIAKSQIDYTTTLTVERGMVLDHLDKYFSIVQMPIDFSVFENDEVSDVELSETIMKDWKVDKDIFAFFMRKEQFA